jgi:hypothetical protein
MLKAHPKNPDKLPALAVGREGSLSTAERSLADEARGDAFASSLAHASRAPTTTLDTHPPSSKPIQARAGIRWMTFMLAPRTSNPGGVHDPSHAIAERFAS